MKQPRASRPHLPGYGVLGPDEGAGLLPWSWAEERLVANRSFWLATVSASGHPHCMPVWAVWLDGGLYFSTGSQSMKTRNLTAHPRCVLTTENPLEPVIVEGICLPQTHEEHSPVLAAYVAKYEMPYPPDSALYRVEPRKVFAFVEDAERFAGSATRWHFD